MSVPSVAVSRKCGRCRRVVPARGGRSPNFCPVCGYALVRHVAMPRKRRGATIPPSATASLMLAFCSFIPMCGLPLGLIAFALGTSALSTIDASGGRYTGRNVANLGRALGAATSIVWLLVFMRACR